MTSTEPHAAPGPGISWWAPRGRVRADLIYVGWRAIPAASQPEPRALRPLPVGSGEGDSVSADWVAAQRREHSRLSRPARLGGAGCAAAAGAVVAAWLGGVAPSRAALLGTAVTACATLGCLRAGWRARSALAEQLRAEEGRVAAFGDAQRRQLAARQQQHAREARARTHRGSVSRRQPLWRPVTLPTTVHRIDVAGGTLAGWSALLTMIAAPRLAAGGEVTVLDLTEDCVAADLVAVARRAAVDPSVWVLPGDLPRFELGMRLPPDVVADVLAQTVNAADGQGGSGGARSCDPAIDAALIGSVLRALGGGTMMPQLIAGLRALGQIGGAAEQLTADGLTHGQLASLSSLAGRTAGHLAVERAWAIEARLRALMTLATSVATVEPSRLQVAWLDRRAGTVSNAVIAAYLVIALTAVLRQAPPARRWQQTIWLLGAERLPGGVLDRLCDAAEVAGAGLVLGYRSIPAHVRERLGRGDAAVGFMRLGNAEDARLAAEQIGTEHRFVVSQLTDTVGASVTDTVGGSYTSTVGTADSITGSDSITTTAGRSRGHSRPGAFVPMADFTGSASRDLSSSAAVCDSRSITAGISAGTSWGWNTSRAVGGSDSAALTAQRSRELLVESHELQQLPQSAVLICYPASQGRRVVLADANPAIMALPTATLATPRPRAAADCGADAAERGPARMMPPGSSVRM
ncbi:MAG TPA: hypothetical protein VLM11_07240 [Streptosporangiaceae bacterium]|nr:hypothetical protein [Streptosporangiaceae bacterium]